MWTKAREENHALYPRLEGRINSNTIKGMMTEIKKVVSVEGAWEFIWHSLKPFVGNQSSANKPIS